MASTNRQFHQICIPGGTKLAFATCKIHSVSTYPAGEKSSGVTTFRSGVQSLAVNPNSNSRTRIWNSLLASIEKVIASG